MEVTLSQETEVHTPAYQPNQTTLAAIEDDQAERMTLEELKAWLIEGDGSGRYLARLHFLTNDTPQGIL